MQGKIIKGIAGFYYVAYKGRVYECKAKGIFRNRNIKPLVGDNVEFLILDEDKKLGNICDILERKSEMIRPALSNIDLLIIVEALTKPKPQINLLDKYLISMKMQGIATVIVWNKSDLVSENEYFSSYASAGYTCINLSAKTGEGIDALKALIKEKSVALAGPSGVGKSTIINMLVPKANMETGDISRKIERGRHTTRHSEFFVIDGDTYLCDTPGFTSVSIDKLLSDELKEYYPEFYAYEGKCKFNACTHTHEPGCEVKKALENAVLDKTRYESYVKNYEELKNLKRY